MTCTTPCSRFVLMRSPLFSNTFSIAVLFGKHFRDQLLEPGATCDRGKMLHQQRADALPLVRIVHGEGDLGRSGTSKRRSARRRRSIARPSSSSTATNATWLTKSTFGVIRQLRRP